MESVNLDNKSDPEEVKENDAPELQSDKKTDEILGKYGTCICIVSTGWSICMETKIKVMQLTHFMTKSLTNTLKQFTWIATTNKLMCFYVVTIVPDLVFLAAGLMSTWLVPYILSF